MSAEAAASPSPTGGDGGGTAASPSRRADRVALNAAAALSEAPCRMLAAASFIVLVVGAGLPIWWHCTATHRAHLPYELIDELWQSDLNVAIELRFVCTDSKCRVVLNDALPRLQPILNEKTSVDGAVSFAFAYSVHDELVPSCHLPEKDGSNWRRGIQYVLVIGSTCGHLEGDTPRVDERGTLVVSAADVDALVRQTVDGLTQLIIDVDRIALVGERHSRRRQLDDAGALQARAAAAESADRRARRSWEAVAKPTTHFDFYIVVPDMVNFDRSAGGGQIGRELLHKLQPFFQYVRPLTNLTVSSQYLYDVQLTGDRVSSSADCKYAIDADSAPHVITPLEKYTVSVEPRADVYRFILYLVPSERTPTCFVDDDHTPLPGNAISVASWGGVVLLNGVRDDAQWPGDHRVLVPLVEQMATTLGLDTHAQPQAAGSWPYHMLRSTLHASIDNALATRAALGSLVHLLNNITNIVITEEVAAKVCSAADSLQRCSAAMAVGDVQSALAHSQSAVTAAVDATDDETLLALLYFPDDQKYAIYIPLGLPVGVPVVFSLTTVITYYWRLWKQRKEKRD